MLGVRGPVLFRPEDVLAPLVCSFGPGDKYDSLLAVVAIFDICQEIGLVALMFFFELLFSYVSLAISLYVFLTNLFSLIPFFI